MQMQRPCMVGQRPSFLANDRYKISYKILRYVLTERVKCQTISATLFKPASFWSLKQNKNNCWNYSCNRKHTLRPLGKGNLYILFACPQSLKIILWSFCIAIWEYCRCYICSFVYNAVNVTNVAVSIAAPIQVLTIDYMIKDILQIKGKYF